MAPRLLPKVSLQTTGLMSCLGVAGNVGPHDRDLLGEFRQLRERAAEGDARNRRGDFARDTANACLRSHLGIEGLDLAGTAVQKEEDGGLIAEERFRFSGEQPRQRQAAECEAADL